MDNPRRFLYNGGKDMGKGDMRMASIRCRACGSVYDYDKEGFCPKCGAYNRPPQREWVDAEGGIRYAGQEQACRGEKVCFEEQTRRPEPSVRRHTPKKNTASGCGDRRSYRRRGHRRAAGLCGSWRLRSFPRGAGTGSQRGGGGACGGAQTDGMGACGGGRALYAGRKCR